MTLKALEIIDGIESPDVGASVLSGVAMVESLPNSGLFQFAKPSFASPAMHASVMAQMKDVLEYEPRVLAS